MKELKAGAHSKPRRRKPLPLYQALLCALFVLPLLLGGLVSLTDTDPVFSEREKRTLSAYPAFRFAALADGSYFSQTRDAYNDTFPLRDFFTDTAASLREALTIRTESGIVLQMDVDAVDGYSDAIQMDVDFGDEYPDAAAPTAFPIADEAAMETAAPIASDADEAEQGASPAAATPAATPDSPATAPAEALVWPEFSNVGFEQFTYGLKSGGMMITSERALLLFKGTTTLAKYHLNSLRELREAFPDKRIVSLLAPTSSAFYATPTYSTGAYEQRAWIDMLRQNSVGIVWPDVYSALEAHRDEYIYFLTDHHWTALGAYYAYTAVAQTLGFEPVDIATLEEGVVEDFRGSLYTQSTSRQLYRLMDSVHYYLPAVETSAIAYTDRSSLRVEPVELPVVEATTQYNKYRSFTRGDQPLIIIQTSAGTGKTAIVIKNSFGNALVPWLCHNYDTLYVIDPRLVNTTIRNQLYMPDYFADIPFDDIYVVFDTEMAGRKYDMMSLLDVPGAFQKWLVKQIKD